MNKRCSHQGPRRHPAVVLRAHAEAGPQSASEGAGSGQAPAHVDPQADGQQVREQQGRQEDFEKLGREHAPLLHDTRVPHAEGGCALRVLEQERLGGDIFRPA